MPWINQCLRVRINKDKVLSLLNVLHAKFELMKRLFVVSFFAAVVFLSCETGSRISVVPYPNEVIPCRGSFQVSGSTIFHSDCIDSATVAVISKFAERLSVVTGKESDLQQGVSDKGIVFLYDSEMLPEAYSLEVTRKCMKIKASGLRGFNYALQTIKQLLPVEYFADLRVSQVDWTIPCVIINDAPRFSYRGMHLDVARHFFGVDEVKKYLDVMELHKLNTFHWHLTDDQGWRIEIKKYPLLTKIGSKRCGTSVTQDLSTHDGIQYGDGKWYTQGQIREIVAYAASKGIDVIPEIDLPGHMLAALAAYPELGCTGGPYNVWYRWGVSNEVLCAGNENIYIFLKDVLSEVCDLFPYEYIHIGGDECPKYSWQSCPKCQAKIRSLSIKPDGRFSAEHYLQSHVMSQMELFLATKGKKVIGWDEILDGDISKTATVMSWRGEKGGIKAAGLGHDVIMTPNEYCYFDYYQHQDTEKEPLAISYLPIERCYSYEPYPESMSEADRKHILGVQANLWTEWIRSSEHLEYMLLPRLGALSEVQWCNADRKDWDRFMNASASLCRLYKTMGYNCADHVFDLIGKTQFDPVCKKPVVSLAATEGRSIYYTLDGSEPGVESLKYYAPVTVSNTCKFSAASYKDGSLSRFYKSEFTWHKAVGCPVSVEHKSGSAFNAEEPSVLVDAIRGSNVRKNREWSLWVGLPLIATIDMDGSEPYSSVCVSTLVCKDAQIFNPVGISISVSDDGRNYTQLVCQSYQVEAKNDPDGLKSYTLSFPRTDSRYLKVEVQCLQQLPSWHRYPNRKGILYVDEIIVE